MQQKTFTFHVHGMHCKACEMMIESELRDVPYVVSADADLNNHSLRVTGHFGAMEADEVALNLTKFINDAGYTLSVEKITKIINWNDFKIAIPIALFLSVLFVLLQKLGIVNWVDASKLSFGTVFLVGVIASLSSCMAVVGGLVLSMSATFAKEGDKLRPQTMFHLGRLVSFFLLGGVIGALGTAFTLSPSLSFVLSLIIGLVMVVLGINLLDIFPWAKRLQPRMPKFIGKHVHNASKLSHSLSPILVGVATFFLPCGFTQSMQIYTLSSGSFLDGALTMFVFALGTLPILALLSFSSFAIHKSSWAGVFFKSAGLLVILFALFNLLSSLVAVGLLSPIFNF